MSAPVTTHGFATVEQARERLRSLGAAPRLLQHTVLVGEAANALLDALAAAGVPCDPHFVRLGALFHDAGKIAHPAELAASGHAHEPAGEALLLEAGVEPALAHCCVSHASWADGASFEERLVALADCLWKGKRVDALEKLVVEGAAARSGQDFWTLFVPLDGAFEAIAADGPARLYRVLDAPP